MHLLKILKPSQPFLFPFLPPSLPLTVFLALSSSLLSGSARNLAEVTQQEGGLIQFTREGYMYRFTSRFCLTQGLMLVHLGV